MTVPTLSGAQTRRLGSILVLEPQGRWDATNALAFLQWTLSLGPERNVILNMGRMRRMDAAAFEYLTELLCSLVARGGEVALVAPAPEIRERLEMGGLDTAFQIFATEAEAADYLRDRNWW